MIWLMLATAIPDGSEMIPDKPIFTIDFDTALPYLIYTIIGFMTVMLLYISFRICYCLLDHMTSIPAVNFEGWSEEEIQSYDLAREFEIAHPPNSIPTSITADQRQLIQEKGVYAWTFVAEPEHNIIVNDRTELTFLGGENCIQTNLPLPKSQPIYYFEVKMFEKPSTTNIGIGIATKPYPTWRFPVGYISKNGEKHYNDPFSGQAFGGPYYEGDVVGCGYRPRSGSIFFTKNGVKIGDAFSGIRGNLFPSIAADGPCTLHVNVGQLGFVFIEANVGKWGFAPTEGSLLAPPAYGLEQGSILLESSNTTNQPPAEEAISPRKPPSYIGDSQNTPQIRVERPDGTLASPPPSYLGDADAERQPLLADCD